MALFKVTDDSLEPIKSTTFSELRLRERGDLQRLLKADISALSSDLFVVTEEFADWQDSSRRIDLLCLDREAHLVVVELKRTEDGGHMELQAIRYAAMVSSMTSDQLVGVHARFLGGDGAQERSAEAICRFLGWEKVDDGQLADGVRIALVSANFSTELTTSVLWLNRQGLNVTCYKLTPYRLDDAILLDIQQFVPLPEAKEYETKLRAKHQAAERGESVRGDTFNRFWAQLIPKSKSRTPIFAGRSTTNDHWLAGSTGKTGFTLNFSMTKSVSRVELYIDRGKNAEKQTLENFRQLESHKDRIENTFGGSLIWQDLPDSRGCRIAYEQPGGWLTPPSEWDALQDRMIDAMVRLEAALRPEISQLS